MQIKPIKVNLRRVVNILFFLSFCIYVKKLPLTIETQPFIIFSVLLGIIAFIKLKISKKDYFLIAHLFTLALYILFQLLFFKTGIIAFITYTVGPIVYLFFLNRIQNISVLLVKCVILLFTILAFILFFKIPILSDIYLYFHKIFISREILQDNSGLRGLTLFAPEPSYFAFSAILLLAILDLKMPNNKALKKYKILVIIIALFTKSALVFLYLLIYFLSFYFGGNILKKIGSFKPRNILIAFVIVICTVIPFIAFNNSRPTQVITNAYEHFEEGISIEKFLLKESSGSTRLIVNSLGFISINYAPFGWGIGEFQNNIPTVGQNYDDLLSKHENIKEAYAGNKPLKAQTYMANLVGDIGVFAFPMVLFLLFSFFTVKHRVGHGLKYVLFFMLVIGQGQISNPCIWITLAILNSNLDLKQEEI